jgi:hypothetical protein
MTWKEGSTPTPAIINLLKKVCERLFRTRIDGVWCNLYRNGSDWTPFHQDQYGAHVYTFSFGATRRFVTQNVASEAKTEWQLASGDVFYFSPTFDAEHKHSVPKTAKVVGERMSVVMFGDAPFSQLSQNDREIYGLPAIVPAITPSANASIAIEPREREMLMAALRSFGLPTDDESLSNVVMVSGYF